MSDIIIDIIKNLIGFLTIVVGILLLLKSGQEKDLAIITTDGLLGSLNIIWGAFAILVSNKSK